MAKKAKSTKSTVKSVAKKEEALSPQEQKTIDSAVGFINKQIDNASSSIIGIGEYLLKNFFDGDIAKAQDRAPRKGISLRKLADHQDINISFAGLSRAVNLAVQEEELGSVSTSKQLTPSHKLLLLKVEDLKEKKKYIGQIEKEGLSVRRFDELLVKNGYSKPRGLAAIDDEKERKLLRSGFRQFINPFDAIIDMDISGLLQMPKTNVRSTFEAAKKARDKLDSIITDLGKQLL